MDTNTKRVILIERSGPAFQADYKPARILPVTLAEARDTALRAWQEVAYLSDLIGTAQDGEQLRENIAEAIQVANAAEERAAELYDEWQALQAETLALSADAAEWRQMTNDLRHGG